MSKLKIGVIGCGGIANQKHFPTLQKNSDLNVSKNSPKVFCIRNSGLFKRKKFIDDI